MDYVALYRKWRPQDFSSLIGQEHIKTAISNALLQNRIAHAYLFSGPRGTGKTSTAKILAKAVNCEKGPTPEPCNECINCERINKGSSMDVFEIDAASNRGIDEIRELREKIRFSPVEGRKRVYIIDEVHMLTTEAFNALLKTLEEPPEHVLFILATTEPHKIPATILSRCQRYDFRRLGIEDTIERLTEVAQKSGLEVTAGALKLISSQADGGMRDALSLLDQCSVMSQGQIDEETVRSLLGIVGKDVLRELLTAVGNKNEKAVLQLFDELIVGGKDIKQLLGEISAYLRALLLFKTSPDFSDIYITDSRENFEKIDGYFTEEGLIASAKRVHMAANELRFSIQPRITAEICLLELCQLSAAQGQAELLARIAALEAKLGGFTGDVLPKQAENTPKPEAVSKKNVVQKMLPEEEFEKPENKKTAEQTANIKVEVVTVKEPPKEDIEKEIILESNNEEKISVQSQITSDADENTPETQSGEAGTLDLGGIWEQLLQSVLKQNKRSLHACAATGKLVSVDKGVAVLQFEGEFACKRMRENDYREVAEKELSLLTGQQLTIDCRSGNKAQAKPQQPNKKSAGKPEKEELPDAVRMALEVFGGEVYKIKK